MNWKCMIIDDEPMARKILREYILETDDLVLFYETDNPVKALNVINEHSIDILFLDIQMPNLNGVDMLKTLTAQPPTIFTSAYAEYALQGYELNVMDYLLKPFSFERFLKACNKTRAYLKSTKQQTHQSNFLFIKSDNAYERIMLDDILFIEAADNFVYIHTPTKKYMAWLTLRHILEDLPIDKFARVHRSFVVALNKIERVKNNLLLIQENEVPLSKQMKEEVMERVLQGKLIKR